MQRRTARRRRSPSIARLLEGLILLALGVVIGLLVRGQLQAIAPAAQQSLSQQADAALEDVVAGAMPSVVPVTIEYSAQRRRGGSSLEELSGSGSYFDARGLVLTNEHVIDEAVSIHVEYEGKMIAVTNYAANKQLDIAVLDVGDAMASATPIRFGDSSRLRIGQPALIIGYPNTGDEALGETFTLGVISGLHATDGASGGINAGMIQTDAAINNGNSGGALLNRSGELVGIPTAKMQSSYGMQFEGLGFAIPITENRDAIEALVEQVLGNRQG